MEMEICQLAALFDPLVALGDRFIVQLCGLQHNLPNVISKLWTWTALVAWSTQLGARFQFNASFN